VGRFTVLITLLSVHLTALLIALIAIRFSLGIGEAVVYPSTNCVVSAWIPSTERGIANGIIFAGVGFGAGVTPRLVVYFLEHGGWRASFWASASIGLAAGAIWFLIARDRPASIPGFCRRNSRTSKPGCPGKIPKLGPAKLNWGAIFSTATFWPSPSAILFRLYRLHFPQLVFHLFKQSSRTGS